MSLLLSYVALIALGVLCSLGVHSLLLWWDRR